jgi:hypothetical protein
LFVQKNGIKNIETYNEFTNAKKLKELQKRVAKKSYKSEKSKWERPIYRE